MEKKRKGNNEKAIHTKWDWETKLKGNANSKVIFQTLILINLWNTDSKTGFKIQQTLIFNGKKVV